MQDKIIIGTVEEEKSRVEALTYKIQSLKLEQIIKQQEEINQFFAWKKSRLSRIAKRFETRRTNKALNKSHRNRIQKQA